MFQALRQACLGRYPSLWDPGGHQVLTRAKKSFRGGRGYAAKTEPMNDEVMETGWGLRVWPLRLQ